MSIDYSSTISDSAILDQCVVGPDSKVQGCMIGANTVIGPNVEIIEVVVDFDSKSIDKKFVYQNKDNKK